MPRPSLSITGLAKVAAARFPRHWQQTLKRLYFGRQIRRGRFRTGEPEFDLLPRFLAPGDWAIDVGANVGHYTMRLSELVADGGRVIAIEPVPETFEILAANVANLPVQNVTVLNVAASDQTCLADMVIPRYRDGRLNYYQAQLSPRASGLQVLCLPLDALALPKRVRLIKIDAEGHELSVLRGVSKVLERDRPVLIVEGSSAPVAQLLQGFGYEHEQLPGSPNLVFMPTVED